MQSCPHRAGLRAADPVKRLRAVLAAGALAVAGTVLPATSAPAVSDPPALSVSPRCTDGTPTPVQLDATGLLGGVPFRIVLHTVALSTTVLEGDTDELGELHRTATLPVIPADHFSLLAVQTWQADGSSGAWSTDRARARVQVCPTLLADPSEVDVAALPRPVSVAGGGWDPGRPVQLSVEGAPGPEVTPGKDGRFVTDLQLPVRPCGPVEVTGLQPPAAPLLASVAAVPTTSGPLEATTSVAVVCPPPPTTPPPTTPPPSTPPPTTPPPSTPPPTTPPTDPSPPDPALAVDGVLPSGGVGMARGSGFVPGRTVTLRWVLPDGTRAPGGATTVAGATGQFVAPCLVLPRAVLGTRVLHARQATSGGALRAATTTLVVGGPMEPGRDRLLGRR